MQLRALHPLTACVQVKETTEDSKVQGLKKTLVDDERRFEAILDTERKRYCLTPKCIRATERRLSNMDSSVRPCGDFWSYACGGWLRRHADGSSIGSELNEKLLEQVRALLKTKPASTMKRLATEESSDMFQTKIGVLYNSCMEEADDNDDGTYLLNEIIDSFGGWSALGKMARGTIKSATLMSLKCC